MNNEDQHTSSKRKFDHLNLAFASQLGLDCLDQRFNYEPMVSAHPDQNLETCDFAGKTLLAPIWISSMTGGTQSAGQINRLLAEAANEFGLGMGLGSCRPLLENPNCLNDFNVRPFLGNERPLLSNLGLAQVEEILQQKAWDKIEWMQDKLQADGLVVHVNPIQEWLQPEGDRFKRPPIEIITQLLETVSIPIVVKEVGQGMGPESLQALLKLPLLAIELAAFGGTNFGQLELLRSNNAVKAETLKPLCQVGHSALNMIATVNQLMDTLNAQLKCHKIIISGGINTFLDGHYFMNSLRCWSIYGQASAFLKYALLGQRELNQFIQAQISGLKMARTFLRIRT